MSVWKQKNNLCDWFLEEAKNMKLSTTLNKNDLQISATARWILVMTTGWKDLHKMMQTKNHKEKPVQFKKLWICVLISFAKGPCCCKCNHTVTSHCISNSCNKRMNHKSYHITYKESLIIIVNLLHTQEVSTLAAALSKLKPRTLRTPSVTKVTT